MKNFFQLFNLAEKFAIDLDELEEKYLSFQQNFHPDKAGIAQIEQSILFNEGYEILCSDFKRAAHILQLHGIDINNDHKAPKPDFATLLEILELQENLDKIDEGKRREIKNKVKNLMQETAQKLDEKKFDEAAQILIKAGYYDKILRK